jgi:hypothetical protein
VTGTKTVATDASLSFGACQDTALLRSPIFGSMTVRIFLRAAFHSPLAYSATIEGGKRTYCDNGTSTLLLIAFATADFGEIEPPNFGETFSASSDSVERARGQKGCSRS